MAVKPIGVYQLGEVPEPLQYQFLDSAGAAFDLTDFTSVAFLIRDPAGVETSHAGTFPDAATGVVQAVWTTAMTDTVGMWSGIFWVSPAPIASNTLVWSVVDGPGPTV